MHPLHPHPTRSPANAMDETFSYRSSVGQHLEPTYRYAHTSNAGGVDRRTCDVSYDYQPDSQRRRPKYTRSKTGCLTCRQKKVKCDESKPNCTRCIHGQRSCTWPNTVPPRRRLSNKKVELLDTSDGRPSTSSSNGVSDPSSTPPRISESPTHTLDSDDIKLVPPSSLPRRHSEPVIQPTEQQSLLDGQRSVVAYSSFQRIETLSVVTEPHRLYNFVHEPSSLAISSQHGLTHSIAPRATSTSPRSSGLVSTSQTSNLTSIPEGTTTSSSYHDFPNGTYATHHHGHPVRYAANTHSETRFTSSTVPATQAQFTEPSPVQQPVNSVGIPTESSRGAYGDRTSCSESTLVWNQHEQVSVAPTHNHHYHPYDHYYTDRCSGLTSYDNQYTEHYPIESHQYEQYDYPHYPHDNQHRSANITLHSRHTL